MWIQSKEVVIETEKASLKENPKLFRYDLQISKPFQISFANFIWNRITKEETKVSCKEFFISFAVFSGAALGKCLPLCKLSISRLEKK